MNTAANTESEEVTEATRRIPVQAMAAMVYPKARRVRLPLRLIFVAAFLSATVGCVTGRPPAADAPETVGALSASTSHVYTAPVHATTDLAPAFQAVATDDDAPVETVTTVTRAPDAGSAGDAAGLPEVAPKDQGLKAGEAR